MHRSVLVTGGCGFIGSSFVRRALLDDRCKVVVLNKATYCGHSANLAELRDNRRLKVIGADIGDRASVGKLLAENQPATIVHLAGETHVDRSIQWPEEFVNTNVVAFHNLIAEIERYRRKLPAAEKAEFRFVHISTDEVYGPLALNGKATPEGSPYLPSSPYAASKGAADLIVRAYQTTYGLPAVIVHFSNVYGPRQHPEKLIPLAILNCLSGKRIPVYGDGKSIRNWVYVEDVCDGLWRIAANADLAHDTYHISSDESSDVLKIVDTICGILEDRIAPREMGSYRKLIASVEDRPGHDRRYELDSTRLRRELGWSPTEPLQSGLEKTVRWYMANRGWLDEVTRRDN